MHPADGQLTLSTLSKFFSSRHFETFLFSYFSQKKRFDSSGKLSSFGDNKHEMSNPIVKEEKRKINSPSAIWTVNYI